MLRMIILFSALGSVGSVLIAGAVLLFKDGKSQWLVPNVVSYATGTLLGAAFIGMIPYALERLSGPATLRTVLFGILLFFVLEELVVWRHCHDPHCDVHSSAGALVLVGDAFHNFVDGIAITMAFVTSTDLGIATPIAVIAHEIPQEVGDFMILVDSGYRRASAMLYNSLSSSFTLVGAVLAYLATRSILAVAPYVLALSAASFIYIALADLIPGRRGKKRPAESILQFALMLAGIATIWAFHPSHS
ncbi:MAG: ZIP family metal transporter [Acidobacteriota bacterium]